MNRSIVLPLFAACLAVVGAFAPGPSRAGPYDQPYVIITTDTAPSADPHLLPVIVNRVDGANAQYGNRAVVAPGPHQVTVDVPPRKAFKVATQHTFELQTQPCTRYFVGAELETTLTQEWKPVIRREERVGEREAKFDFTPKAR